MEKFAIQFFQMPNLNTCQQYFEQKHTMVISNQVVIWI